MEMSKDAIKDMIKDFIKTPAGRAEADVMDLLGIDEAETEDLYKYWEEINDTVEEWLPEITDDDDVTVKEVEEARLSILELIDIEVDMRM